MRAFGNMLAEVPIIATRCQARRKGHARYLMAALENLLREVRESVFQITSTAPPKVVSVHFRYHKGSYVYLLWCCHAIRSTKLMSRVGQGSYIAHSFLSPHKTFLVIWFRIFLELRYCLPLQCPAWSVS